jgi:hypothetical protein
LQTEGDSLAVEDVNRIAARLTDLNPIVRQAAGTLLTQLSASQGEGAKPPGDPSEVVMCAQLALKNSGWSPASAQQMVTAPIASAKKGTLNNGVIFLGALAGFVVIQATFPRQTDFFTTLLLGFIGPVMGSTLALAVKSVTDAFKERQLPSASDQGARWGVVSLVLGVIGLAAWLFPLAGIAVGIAAMVTGRLGRWTARRQQALAGMTLGLVVLFISVGNGFLGALSATSAFR